MKYCLVENPGTDREHVSVWNLGSLREAFDELHKRYCREEVERGFAQIMKEHLDGTLTTEI